MKLQINYFHSPDVDDLKTWTPTSLAEVYVLVQIMVGPVGRDDAAESFDVVVATPEAMRLRVDETTDPIIGRHHLLVAKWDWELIESFLRQQFESEEAETWDELGARLGRIGHWEFEDYVEHPDIDERDG